MILQCETPITTPGNHPPTTTVPGRRKCGDGSILSVDSTPTYESSSASSSSCLSMMPPTNNAGINGGGQGVFVAENAHYFELPTERGMSPMGQRGLSASSASATAGGNSNPALLSRVHHLLFGGGSGGGCENSSNDYQNVRHFIRSSPTPRRSKNQHGQGGNVDSRDSEASQLEVLQQRLAVHCFIHLCTMHDG